jgi:hypothetical protein
MDVWNTGLRTTTGAVFLCGYLWGASAVAEPPNPTLASVFPAGAAAGTSVDVTLAGNALTGLRKLRSNIPDFHCELQDATHCRVTIPAATPPGLYDLWAVCENGVTAPRRFFVSQRQEHSEAAPNDSVTSAASVPLNSVVNGSIEQPGDVDYFRFEARQGQRVVIECWAERIDSRLRAILEVFDDHGRRLAVNRGYYGVDPLIDLHVPVDGAYIVKVHDLISTGGTEHYYRLDIDTGPRVAFTVPNVIPRGRPSRITVFGWNLTTDMPSVAASAATGVADPKSARISGDLDRVDVEIPAALAQEQWPLPVGLAPAQIAFSGFAYHFPGSHASVAIGVSDLPILTDRGDNHAPETAQLISCPCEVSGRLVAGDERDWFAIEAARGEVLYFDVLSQRIGSPADLQLVIFNASGEQTLLELNDHVRNDGGVTLPTAHLDPAGRWVVPANGRYLIMVRNLIGGSAADPRRSYRLSVRRAEADYQLVFVPRSAAPRGLNVRRGGREAFDVLAFRKGGMNDAIRVSATGLPTGVACPEIVLGPGVDRATMAVSADASVAAQLTALKLEGYAESVGRRPVRGSTVVREGVPNGWSRLTSEIPMSVSGDAPVRTTAAIQDVVDHHLYGRLRMRYAPGSVLDVAVTIDHRDPEHRPAARLMGIGLPPAIRNQTAVIPAGKLTGNLSFYLPPTLAAGQYSLVVAAETTVPAGDGKFETVSVHTNPVAFTVEPAAFLVEVDPFAPRKLKRGETIQLKYSTERRNGFIGKIHTELAAPGVVTDVPGLRGRGETFVGQSDHGMLQIVVNDDAPLGAQPFVRLFSVGVLEDQPVFQGAGLFPVEIVE